MTNVAKFREKNKAEFGSRYGTKLSFMPFIFQAATNALRKGLVPFDDFRAEPTCFQS
jgi:pyruvate/2-oxoglutarate dehydrogenase complex dihydrolipoamide acyltransferase (E2) component